jgi:hypothetical protein
MIGFNPRNADLFTKLGQRLSQATVEIRGAVNMAFGGCVISRGSRPTCRVTSRHEDGHEKANIIRLGVMDSPANLFDENYIPAYHS